MFKTVFAIVVCLPGYFGMNCSSECPFPSFGFLCDDACLCNTTECHHVKGCRRNINIERITTVGKYANRIVCYEIHWSNAHYITVLFVLQNNKEDIQCIF